MFWVDSYFNRLSVHTLGLKNRARKKKIRIFYPSLQSNPRKPLIKAFIFSLLTLFWLSLSITLPEGKGEEVKAQGGAFFDAQSCCGERSKQRS